VAVGDVDGVGLGSRKEIPNGRLSVPLVDCHCIKS
jgi:hypothetical protein